jgi:hypothetical protein
MFSQKDYKKFVVDIGKYHYLIANSNKSIILSSSNSKSEARQEALNKLQPIMNAVLGKHIYLLTIRTISKKDLKTQEGTTLKLLGGPIEITAERIRVVSPTKLKNIGGYRNNIIYLTDNYLQKYKEIKRDSLEQSAFDLHNRKLKQGPLDVNKYND